MTAAAQPLHKVVSWRRALTPVFAFKRYPGGYWLLLDAICAIATYYPTATLGVESLSRRTGLSRRYVERMRNRLEAEGVIQLVEQSTGGRFPDSERKDAPGRANVYALGPVVYRIPLKPEPRPTDRGSTPVYRPRFGAVEPRPTDRGSHPAEPRSGDPPTHALSADVRVQSTVSGEIGGEGGGKRTVALTGDPPPASPSPTIAASRFRNLIRNLNPMNTRGQTP